FKLMTVLVLLSVLAGLLAGCAGKIFQRCELAQALHEAGMNGFHGYSLPDWLCMAFFESGFDTGTVVHEPDGSSNNGIFQINSRLWCNDYKTSSSNLCHMHCSGESLLPSVRTVLVGACAAESKGVGSRGNSLPWESPLTNPSCLLDPRHCGMARKDPPFPPAGGKVDSGG
uniref:Sperm acrosome membrane-associated protein 3 n=1 Tax=Crocodylus porosus TaxID=8502 RepID=A0A7M4E9H1_CROPO